MEDTKRAMGEILEHIQSLQKNVKGHEVEQFIDALLKSKRVFVVGAGRSGLVAKAFVMRLMHLGMDVYVIGETITPALRAKDTLLAISGSGETELIVETAKIGKKIGAKIIAVTTYPKSPLAKLADVVVTLPGRKEVAAIADYMKRELFGEYAPLAPLGTLFEVGVMVFLDGVIAAMMVKLGKKEEDLRARHATIE
ncbi:MAG: 6-phospho-3-hexuloisomerase [Candidatus Hadarchaeota archaeon]